MVHVKPLDWILPPHYFQHKIFVKSIPRREKSYWLNGCDESTVLIIQNTE